MKPVLRVFAAVLPLALAASPALAQRSDQLELGGYASFTRFDRAFLPLAPLPPPLLPLLSWAKIL